MRNLRQRVIEDVDCATLNWFARPVENKFWSDYNKPRTTYYSFVQEQFAPAQILCKTASSSTLKADFDARYDTGELRRSSSYTSLAPSLGMAQSDRQAARYSSMSQFRVYAPKTQQWRTENVDAGKLCAHRRNLYEKRAGRTHRMESRVALQGYTPPSARPYKSPYESPMNASTRLHLYRPASMSRPSFDYHWHHGRLLGTEPVMPFRYRDYFAINYDDRLMNRVHYGTRTGRTPVVTYRAPYVRRYNRSSLLVGY